MSTVIGCWPASDMEAGEGEDCDSGGGEERAGGVIGEDDTITDDGEEALFGDGAAALESIIKMLGKFNVSVGRCVSMGVREGEVEGGMRALSSSSCCWPPNRLSCTCLHASVRNAGTADEETGGA